MRQLKLHYEKLIQGEFSLKELNLLLVFQVNCPGCFLYAIPMFNKLFSDKRLSTLSFLGLSTAFEDFNMNTMENTKLLVEKNQLVGETKKVLQNQGYTEIPFLPFDIKFPIAFDKQVNEIQNLSDTVSHICNLNPNYKTWSEFDKTKMKEKVEAYLKNLEHTYLTFVLNQLQGTPSIILFNSDYEILYNWFGHQDYNNMVEIIKFHIKTVN